MPNTAKGRLDAFRRFGLGEPRHALERIRQRTTLDPDLVHFLQAEADKLVGLIPEGFYYLPLLGINGETLRFAAFKTIASYPHARLVLATILGPEMKPRGTSLSHIMQQPLLTKTAEELSTPYDRVLKQRFSELQGLVREHGAYAGTAHKRILIPKTKLTEHDISRLGFTPVTIAIPEAGQDRFQSFRHPDNNFHIHSHPDGWTMHEDSHPAATMLAKKVTGISRKAKAMAQGIPHASEEGLPGLYYYMKGVIGGHRSTAQRVFHELPVHAKLKLYGMANSPSAFVKDLKSYLEEKRDNLIKASEYIPGIPSRKNYGDPLAKLEPGHLLDFVIHEHKADKAGLHYDVRLGNESLGLFSWATKKSFPKPGERIALFQQPLHSHAYGKFEGEIKSGYGKGKVDIKESGKVLVTKVTDDTIHFTKAHTRYPERFVLVKPKNDTKQWLFINVTPTKPLRFEKEHYKTVKPTKVDELMAALKPGMTVQPKVDGAAVFITLDKDKVEIASHRVSKETGRPIVHTERVLGGKGQIDLPRKYKDTVLRAEVYGVKGDKVLPVQELGGLLNSSVARSLTTQRENDITLKNLVFDIKQVGKKTTNDLTYSERKKIVEDVIKYLPSKHFEIPEEATTPAAARKLLNKIQHGEHPLTEEGIVIHSQTGVPQKVKLTDEHDVYVKGVFPGEGKYSKAAGGFTYSLTPDGNVVGKVGIGLSDKLRSDLWENKDSYIDRVARVKAQDRLPSGALRVPVLLAFHEDYPTKVASLLLDFLKEKLARVTTDLKDHQSRVVNRMAAPDQPGLVAVHGLGSGKTLTSIAVADRLGLPADVVVPAALQGNYQKELIKHTDKPPDTQIQSLENVARKGPQSLTRPLMIVDEAHRMRNPGKTQATLMKSPAKKKLLLTGSLFYNHPADMAAPINLVAGQKTLPTSQSDFEGKFIRERRVNPGFFGRLIGKPGHTVLDVNPREKKNLQGLLKKYVDYHPGSSEGFPTREDQVINVKMTPEQRETYDTVMEAAPRWVREKVRQNLPPSKSESTQLNSFLTGVRQVSNTTGQFDIVNDPYEPKIDRAVHELNTMLNSDPQAKAVVYSNFLSSGIDPYKRHLDQLKIPYGEFSGAINKKKRDQLVNDYNENKIRALLLSSAGGEGLDLKGTRLMQILDPAWNAERINQVIGRGIRFKSHDHLPPEKRKVLIQRFLATRPRVGMLEKMRLRDPGSSVDEYLYNLSKDKDHLNEQFRQLLPK
jgi:hypothetical protein